jgi:hypothetical protein
MANFSDLIGKIIISIHGLESGSDNVVFKCSDGSEYTMYHAQDCCENVSIDDVNGDIDDLLNSPILKAEETNNEPDGFKDPHGEDSYRDSWTWTFYHLATIKGYVTIRWYGESNGYYSESVSFVDKNEDRW